jgi:glutamate 5-kinase
LDGVLTGLALTPLVLNAARSAREIIQAHLARDCSSFPSLDFPPPVCYPVPMRRMLLKGVTRLVVKLGTGVLTDSRKQPDFLQLVQLVAQMAQQRQAGREVLLVTSGAVGAGMGGLGLQRRPTRLHELQACAAVGQSRLMAMYADLFEKFGLRVAQVLLTHGDLEDHDRHLNARNTLLTLLERGVVPIINENDVVSVEELKFGDNDKLSALVANLLPADLLVILTSVDGVIERYDQPDARLIPVIERVDETLQRLAQGTRSETAVGGMSAKVEAARIVMRAGIPLVIANGRKRDVLARVLAGEDEGTLFVPAPEKLASRKRWIAFFHHPKGALIVDDGARRALVEQGRSLLLPGVVRCEGEFERGDVLRICDAAGREFARGLAGYSAAAVRERQASGAEVVHRDNLVIL